MHSVVGEVGGSLLPGAAPVRTRSIRQHVSLLCAIEVRLFDDAPFTGIVPTSRSRPVGGPLMFDLAALGVVAVCFAFCFFFLFVMEKV